MKHKLLISLIAAMSLATTATVTNKNVQASKSDDIFMYGYWIKHPYKYFKNWKKVVLTKKCLFSTESDNENSYIYKDMTLKKGQIIQIKSVHYEWRVRGSQFKKYPGNYWYLPETSDGYEWNDRTFSRDGYLDNYNFATIGSYVGLSTIFIPSRKVKVIKPITAYKIKQEVPAYKNHIVGKTRIKKGTILTVTGPSNHWSLKVSGKGVREHYPYIWNVGKATGWYKLID